MKIKRPLFKKLTKEEKIEKKINKMESKFLYKEREKYHKELITQEEKSSEEEKVAPDGYFISLRNINKIYDNHVQAVYNFNLDIKRHEFIVFVGPSGCGKSTTLRMIAGLEDITSGDLFIDGKYANYIPPKDRNLSMVFQSYALYPHMSVYDNLAFSLKIKKFSKEDIDKRVNEVSELLEIKEYLQRKPKQLSGGQCQRVSLGRAIMRNVPLYLMDEPLSNLDAKLRVIMRGEIVKLHNKIGATTIYVTHDQTEAMTMATRIVVMNKGYIQQIGTPEEIYNNPSNIFVASFIGSPAMNILDATIKNNKLIITDNIQFELSEDKLKKIKEFYNDELSSLKEKLKEKMIIHEERLNKIKNEKEKEIYNKVDSNIEKLERDIDTIQNYLVNNEYHVKFGIRPEDIVKGDKFKSVISLSELLGSEYFIHLKIDNIELVSKVDAKSKFLVGDNFSFDFTKTIHLFSNITGNRII